MAHGGSGVNRPVIRDGVVLAAPRPARLCDEIHPGLWLGGWARDYAPNFDHVVDCIHFRDGPDLPIDLAALVADVCVSVRRRQATLVRCALGLNRSALVAGLAFRSLSGRSGAEVIQHMRAVRSRFVLCNPAFEAQVTR